MVRIINAKTTCLGPSTLHSKSVHIILVPSSASLIPAIVSDLRYASPSNFTANSCNVWLLEICAGVSKGSHKKLEMHMKRPESTASDLSGEPSLFRRVVKTKDVAVYNS